MRFSARSFKIAATMMFLSSMRDQHMSMTQALPDKGTDKKSKQALDAVDPDFLKKFSPFMSQDIIQDWSKKAHDLFESGGPGKIGYGFMMGYSSGYCLKKVSKMAAFVLGGMFIAVQTLSYNGFLVVNYDKVQKEIEGVLDLNKDGKLDEKDLNIAYDKVYNVVSYNMPTGGGFSVGFVAGLRA